MLSTFRQTETVLIVYNGPQPLPKQFNEEWAEVLMKETYVDGYHPSALRSASIVIPQ
jgi:hypothetical protein